MNSKSSFSRRTWLLCSKRRKLFSSKRLSSVQKIHTAPFRATFVGTAMRRDLSPPLSSYFPRKTESGAPRISPDEKTVESTCKIEGSTLRVAFKLQKTVDQSGPTLRTPRRLAAIAVSVLAVIGFFLGKLNSSVKIRRVPRNRHRNFRHACHVPLHARSCCPDIKACQKQLPNSL